MAKPDEGIRNFKIPDQEMIQYCRVVYGLFAEDKAGFSGFDSAFSDPFAENWLAKINLAADTSHDALTLSQLTELTGAVESKMDESREHFQEIKYFIEKAFPDKREVWSQFGYNDYEGARKSEVKMIQFLGILYKTASEYKDELIAAGYGNDKIERIKALQNELTESDYQQELLKKKRPAVTRERIELLNECYEYLKKVSKASKIIFAQNKVKYDQYLLPQERTAKKEEEPAVQN